MLSSVNSAGGASAGSKALEARRQEIVKSAQEQGGAQARAVRFGKRQAEAAGQSRAAETPTTTEASKKGPASQNPGQTRRVGWEVSLDTKPYSPKKGETGGASTTVKGSNVDVVG